ncbi:TPA: TraK family protein [Legionella pneumophila]|nr:TraK family protein [Legionella pneumophila]
MGSSLSERIAAKQAERQVSDKSVNKAAFLALKQDIATALADGWSIKLVWETLVEEGKISFSYKTFCGYVARLIVADQKPSLQENTKEDEKAKSKAKSEIRGFTFNPKPNLKELL